MIVVLPMAGHGSRFKDAGYSVPKPFIPVHDKPMFMHALKSIEGLEYSLIVFILLKDHAGAYDIDSCLKELSIPNYKIILLDKVTEGQLDTVLKARAYLDRDEDVLILSSDTYVQSNIAKDITGKSVDCAGIISVAKLEGSHWSFARLDENNNVDIVAEKERISDLASTGLYYFSNGKDFLRFADNIIEKKEKTRNEYYVIPVYQKYINAGHKIQVSIATEVWDMGTPESLKVYLERK